MTYIDILLMLADRGPTLCIQPDGFSFHGRQQQKQEDGGDSQWQGSPHLCAVERVQRHFRDRVLFALLLSSVGMQKLGTSKVV